MPKNTFRTSAILALSASAVIGVSSLGSASGTPPELLDDPLAPTTVVIINGVASVDAGAISWVQVNGEMLERAVAVQAYPNGLHYAVYSGAAQRGYMYGFETSEQLEAFESQVRDRHAAATAQASK